MAKTLDQHISSLRAQQDNAVKREYNKYIFLAEIAQGKIFKNYQLKAEKKSEIKRKRREEKIERFKKNRARKEKGHKIVQYIDKRPTLAQLWQELLVVFQEWVRLKDTDDKGYGHCITCKCMLHRRDPIGNKKPNAGHGISSSNKGSALMLENVNIQCNGCNQKQYITKDLARYATAVNHKYGKGTRERIEEASKVAVVLGKGDYTREILELRIEQYKQSNILLRANKGTESF